MSFRYDEWMIVWSRKVETYQSLCTEFYDLDKPEAPKDALGFYLKFAEKAEGLKPHLSQQYLHETKLNKKYKLIFIPSASFGLITEVEIAKTSLKILYDSLLPNGKLVFEVETMQA